MSAPVAVLVDYDGTISTQDTVDALLHAFVEDQAEVQRLDVAYDEGTVGSRELMAWDLDALGADPERLLEFAAGIALDDGMVEVAAACRARGALVEVVSDGLGFYVAPAMARLGLADVAIITNEARFSDGRVEALFPNGHPRCFVCGTCKRERVRTHQAAGRVVVFVGDGTSDRFAAAHADVAFAKESLARICDAEGWPYVRWTRLSEVAAWLDTAWREGRLPVDASEVPAWRAASAPAPRPFICGPEVWGEGRITPGPGPRGAHSGAAGSSEPAARSG
jgi:2,3-diketo-5-methylthio-1-phosphopentane phosphatase